MTCTCGTKMTKYEQPALFGQSFTFWKCPNWKCPNFGKMLKEEIGGNPETARTDRKQDSQDS